MNVISSLWQCSRIFGWNRSDVQVASAEAPRFVLALALATCTSGQFQASKG
jgi:hypothetical protein